MKLPAAFSAGRMSRIVRLGAVAAVLVALAGCTATLGVASSGPPHSATAVESVAVPLTEPLGPWQAGPADVLLKVDVLMPFQPREWDLVSVPSVVLFGDGTLLTRMAGEAGIPSNRIAIFRRIVLSQDQLDGILLRFNRSGLLTEDSSFGEPDVFDTGFLTVSITVGSTTITHGVDGPGLEPLDLTKLSTAEHQSRDNLLTQLADIRRLVGDTAEVFQPEAVAVYRVDPQEVDFNVAKSTAAPLTWPIKSIPGQPKSGWPWPCVIVSGPELAALLPAIAEAEPGQPWVSDADGLDYPLFRPVLPEDPGCQRR